MSAVSARYLAADVVELEQAGKLIVTVNGVEIGLFAVNGSYYAWRNLCPHAFAPVCEGRVCGTRLASNVYEYIQGRDREILRCPWHGWEFDLITGKHLGGDSARLRGFPVEQEHGKLYVRMKS